VPSKSTFSNLNRFPDEFVSKIPVQFRHPPYGRRPGVTQIARFRCVLHIFLTKIASFDFFEIFLKLDEGQKMSGENPFQATIAFP